MLRCDYKSKTIHLDHISAVSFTVSWDCQPASRIQDPLVLSLNVHTSTAGLVYDSAPVQTNLLTQTNPQSTGTIGQKCSIGQKRWQVTTSAQPLPGRFAKVQLERTGNGPGQFANISVVATLIGAE
jgi:hypothetical protein